MSVVAIVTVLALIVYMYTALRVGLARGQYGVDAPAVSGHPIFERHYRVQMNTLEQLMVFLPALWLFATYASAAFAAGIGVVFVIGRVIYAVTYVADPRRRTVGFLLGFLANVILVVGALIGGGLALLRG